MLEEARGICGAPLPSPDEVRPDTNDLDISRLTMNTYTSPSFIVDPDVDLTSAGLLDLLSSRRRNGTQVDSSSQQSGASKKRPAKRPKVLKTADIDFKLLGFL